MFQPVRTGPKRRRRSRRQLPYGQLRMWGKSDNLRHIRETRAEKAAARADRRIARTEPQVYVLPLEAFSYDGESDACYE